MPNADLSDASVEDTNDDHDSLTVKHIVVGKKRKKRNYMRRDYPKKALSAYNIFFKETREKILTEYGKTNFQEMVRKIAALWKEITTEDKIRFDRIADRDLSRYKEEVCEYERKIVEKNLKMLHTEEEKKKQAIVDADARTHQENHGIKRRNVLPVQNAPIAKSLRDDMMDRSVQGLSDSSTSDYFLTSNELQLAQHRLREELNSIEELQPPTEKQFYQQNFQSIGSNGDRTMTSGDDSAGLVHASVSYEFELRKQFGLGTGSIAALNQTRLENNINKTGNDPLIALGEGAIRNMVCKAEMQIGRSGTREDSVKIPHLGASNEDDIRHFLLNQRGGSIQNYLNHQGNQIEQSNGTQTRNRLILSAFKRGHAETLAEIRKRLITEGDHTGNLKALETQKCLSMNSTQNPFSASDAELQRITMVQVDRQSISEQLGRSIAIVRRQQEILRQQESYMNQLNCDTLPSSHGRLSGVKLSVLGDLRFHPLPDAHHL